MLVLRTLSRGAPLHGFEIAQAILQRSEEVLRVEEGSLYPALQRMPRGLPPRRPRPLNRGSR
jgi:PadR family transcriptional regulator PadR